MKREVSQEEREIRNSMVDILCFLATGKASREQLVELNAKISGALSVFQKAAETEQVKA